jgi:hypothetical protein
VKPKKLPVPRSFVRPTKKRRGVRRRWRPTLDQLAKLAAVVYTLVEIARFVMRR